MTEQPEAGAKEHGTAPTVVAHGDSIVYIGGGGSYVASNIDAAITCPRCGRTSYNANDIRALYCGFCHWWTSDPQLGAPDVIAQLEFEGKLPKVT